jgi:hypothetical protein
VLELLELLLELLVLLELLELVDDDVEVLVLGAALGWQASETLCT